jgi:chorismate mutase
MADPVSELSLLRENIDAVDSAILKLIAERAKHVLRVGDIKREAGMAVYDPDRERQVLERLASMATPPLDAETVRRVFERIIDESRRLEQRHMSR